MQIRINAKDIFKVVRLEVLCLRLLLCSFMRSWIINIRLSQILCTVGTAESECLLFQKHIAEQVVLQGILPCLPWSTKV